MKTSKNNISTKSVLFTVCLIALSSVSKAASFETFANNVYNELFKGNSIGLYIIGGILSVSIIAYFIVSKIQDKEEEEERRKEKERPHHLHQLPYERHHHSHWSQQHKKSA